MTAASETPSRPFVYQMVDPSIGTLRNSPVTFNLNIHKFPGRHHTTCGGQCMRQRASYQAIAPEPATSTLTARVGYGGAFATSIFCIRLAFASAYFVRGQLQWAP